MTETKQWYTHDFRRNLVDMHIADWNKDFLSEFSPEEYVSNLKRAHIQSPMLYLQAHTGLCYFPTQSGRMHAAFRGREDLLRRLTALCRREGMHPVGYYSLIYNTDAEDTHPAWRVQSHAVPQSDEWQSDRQALGSRYGLCCPNNPEYRAFLKAQIDEMAAFFCDDPDTGLCGMFYDMTYWPGICHCPHCKKLYKEAAGRDAYPAENWSDPDWLAFIRLRNAQIGEFAQFVTAYTKEKMPGVTVEHNYSNGVASNSILCGSTELVNDACDYTGGDLYGDLYNHSFTAKYYYGVTKHPPFEYMTCRCDPNLLSHTISKTEEHLATEVLLTAAHHGASFIIDAIDPVGTLDSRVYDRIGRVFERQIPYEPYFRGTLFAEAAVFYSTAGRYNARNLPYNSKTCAVNTVRTLIEANIPTAVTGNAGSGTLSPYRVVLAPAIAGLSEESRRNLISYAENGGVLYFSGTEEPELLSRLLGASMTGYTEETAVYLAPTEAGQPLFGEFTPAYPLPTEWSLPVITGGSYEVLAVMKLPYTKPAETRFASIHSNPPGIPTDLPALVTKKVGRGRVIWSAAPISFDGRRAHRKLLLSLLSAYLPPFSMQTDAPRQVELVTFRDHNEWLISAVDLLCTDELLPVPDFTIRLKTERPEAVLRIGGKGETDTPVPFTYENGMVSFRAEHLTMFAMYRIITG